MLLVSLIYVMWFCLTEFLKVFPFDKKHLSSCPRHVSTDGTDFDQGRRSCLGASCESIILLDIIRGTMTLVLEGVILDREAFMAGCNSREPCNIYLIYTFAQPNKKGDFDRKV